MNKDTRSRYLNKKYQCSCCGGYFTRREVIFDHYQVICEDCYEAEHPEYYFDVNEEQG